MHKMDGNMYKIRGVQSEEVRYRVDKGLEITGEGINNDPQNYKTQTHPQHSSQPHNSRGFTPQCNMLYGTALLLLGYPLSYLMPHYNSRGYANCHPSVRCISLDNYEKDRGEAWGMIGITEFV